MFNCIPEVPNPFKRPLPPMPPVFHYAACDVDQGDLERSRRGVPEEPMHRP